MLLLRHHRGLDGHDHVEDARSGIRCGFTVVSFAGRTGARGCPTPDPSGMRVSDELDARASAHYDTKAL
jgi:hypothetical protein